MGPRASINKQLQALYDTYPKTDEIKVKIAALKLERDKYPAQVQLVKDIDTDQSAADDYLDYLHDSW